MSCWGRQVIGVYPRCLVGGIERQEGSYQLRLAVTIASHPDQHVCATACCIERGHFVQVEVRADPAMRLSALADPQFHPPDQGARPRRLVRELNLDWAAAPDDGDFVRRLRARDHAPNPILTEHCHCQQAEFRFPASTGLSVLSNHGDHSGLYRLIQLTRRTPSTSKPATRPSSDTAAEANSAARGVGAACRKSWGTNVNRSAATLTRHERAPLAICVQAGCPENASSCFSGTGSRSTAKSLGLMLLEKMNPSFNSSSLSFFLKASTSFVSGAVTPLWLSLL
jgi:hypothetical protein